MLKIIFSGLSIILSISCFLPYIRDIFKKTTQPHVYTWFIWGVLQSTATIIMLKNGAGWGAASIGVGALLCLYIFTLSLRYGTKHIKKIDTFCLIASLATLIFWAFTKDALISVILVSVIDFIGFIPTFRKSYEEPETETSLTYTLSALSLVFALLSLEIYSVVTVLYLASILVTNSICSIIIITRRKQRNMQLS